MKRLPDGRMDGYPGYGGVIHGGTVEERTSPCDDKVPSKAIWFGGLSWPVRVCDVISAG